MKKRLMKKFVQNKDLSGLHKTKDEIATARVEIQRLKSKLEMGVLAIPAIRVQHSLIVLIAFYHTYGILAITGSWHV